MSDTLSHVSLAGVAFGLVLGLSPTLITVIVVMIAAVFLEYLRTIYKEFHGNRDGHSHVYWQLISLIVMSKGKVLVP